MKSLFLFICGCFLIYGSYSAQTAFTADFTDPAGSQAVPRFSKVEIGVGLPGDLLEKVNNFLQEKKVAASSKINPFLEWEFDVEAEFRNAESGTVKKIDGFYYRDYERDEAANSWKEKFTAFPVRVRFAPGETGKWTCTVTMSSRGTIIPGSVVLEFLVTESENKGYVSVHENRKNLQLGNKMIFPVGINFPSPTNEVMVYHTGPGRDLFTPDQSHAVTNLKNWLDYHKDISDYHEAGGKYIRTLQSGWSSLIEFEKKGNYYDRQPYAWEQDQLLEYCEKNGMYIHFNLMQQEPIMKYGNYDMFDWDWSHYRSDGSYFYDDIFKQYAYANGNEKEPYEMFLRDSDLRYHEQRMRYYISRYGYSTSIYVFELLSEPWHLNQVAGREEPVLESTAEGDSVRLAVFTFHTRMAKYIHETMGHDEHLIGVDFFNVTLAGDEKFIDKSVQSEYIDVVSINPYSRVPEKYLISKSTPNNEVNSDENSMFRYVNDLHTLSGKPVLIAEGGSGDGADDCSGFLPQHMDMASFAFTGVASFNSWVGWGIGLQPQWAQVIRAFNHINQKEILAVLENGKGQWIQGRQAEKVRSRDRKKAKELQYYVAADGSGAIGYVKNRTANFHTKRTSEKCSDEAVAAAAPLNTLTDITWSAGTKELFVSGLAAGANYEVKWYDALTGELILTQCQRSRRKYFILKFPGLTVTDPASFHPQYWFVITASDCDN